MVAIPAEGIKGSHPIPPGKRWSAVALVIPLRSSVERQPLQARAAVGGEAFYRVVSIELPVAYVPR
jgi:hypothetical protein